MTTQDYQAWAYTRRGHPSETLERLTKPVPRAGKGEVVLRVKAASINPVDYKFGAFPDFMRRAAGAPRFGTPCVPCFDYAGIVHEAGEGSRWAVGDEVFGRLVKLSGNGSLQEYLAIPASDPITRKPADVSWVQAAALPLVYLTVYGCLVQRTGLPFDPSSLPDAQAPPTSVLILGGTSATGSVAVQMAKKMGLRVAVTCSGASRELAERLGADECIDYKTEDVPARAKASKLGPFAVILDCVGGTDLIPHMDELLLRDSARPRLGQYISIVGDDQSNLSFGTIVSLVASQTYRTLRGYLDPYIPSYFPFRPWLAGRPYAFHMEEPRQDALDTAPAFLRAVGEIMVDEVYPFDRATEAFARSESGRAKGKVVVEFE